MFYFYYICLWVFVCHDVCFFSRFLNCFFWKASNIVTKYSMLDVEGALNPFYYAPTNNLIQVPDEKNIIMSLGFMIVIFGF